MENAYHLPWWKEAPFTRLLLPLIAGLYLQHYFHFSVWWSRTMIIFVAVILITFRFLSVSKRYEWRSIQGLFIQLLLIAGGMLLYWQKDIRHRSSWYGHLINDSSYIIVSIAEQPVQRTASTKAEASVIAVINKNTQSYAEGKLLLYFAGKDTAAVPGQGDKILLKKQLQPIRGSGNPGAFDYGEYAAFQQLFHSIYLRSGEYILLSSNDPPLLQWLLTSTRNFILTALRKYLPPEPEIIGIAEALLIGYKEELDGELLQVYSNTGVVHIIAISGLHLGLLYVLLVWLLDRAPFIKRKKLLKALLVLGFLWFFSLLTGASASVLRSAVMFTCIVIGKNFFRQASVYNSLAASAFLLLSYNPCFLWDVGFQLSYLAIYGIVWLQQPLFRFVFIKNKWLQKLWEMASITIAAQIVTFPVCLLYFHQFPNYFLLANLVAVPLSTVVLFAEILLISIAWLAPVAMFVGKITCWMIWLMNRSMTFCSELPYSVITHIYATPLTTIFLYGITLLLPAWILYKKKWMLIGTMIGSVTFAAIFFFNNITNESQYKLIVYNVPKFSAVDIIYQNKHLYFGDAAPDSNDVLRKFHLDAARTLFRCSEATDSVPGFFCKKNIWQFGNRSVLVIDTAITLPAQKQVKVDILLLSHNARVRLKDILAVVRPAIVIIDGSNNLWKITQWKKECEELLLPCFPVTEKGAFILDLSG